MRRISLLLFSLLTLKLLQAQAPQGINYQAVIRDGNTVIANQSVDILLAFEDANNNILYRESHNNLMTNDYGLINIILGKGTPIIGTFEQIDWSEEGVQFEAEVTFNGSIYSLGRVPLQSVAYSLYADRAGAIESDLLEITDSNGNLNFQAGRSPSNANFGIAGVADVIGTLKSYMDVWPATSSGRMLTFSSNGSLNSRISYWNVNKNSGVLSLYDHKSARKATISASKADQDNSGFIQLIGANSSQNFQASGGLFPGISQDHGGAAVYDSLGSAQAGMYVDSIGNGIIFGDIKNFRIPHPLKSDQEIWYASLEGPEAAAYIRGTGQISKGEGLVSFPEHYSAIINPQTLTVVLTPLSEDSKGMAVVEKTAQGFKVKELRQGKGDYSFDWEVKAVRLGYENYRPVRNIPKNRPGNSAEEDEKKALPSVKESDGGDDKE